MSIDELQALLRSRQALTFTGQSRARTYTWIERTLRQYGYLARSRAEKGLLRQYLQNLTGLSRAQLYRTHTTQVMRTKPATAQYGEHRRPNPQGQPG